MYLEINGSEGEGGGQILRSSLAMSAVLGQPVRFRSIRAGRDRPGLHAQHLTCVNALAKITGADVAGANLGSQELAFAPHTIRAGTYRFDVAEVSPSAGSLSLVFQAIALPLAFANDVSRITLSGGTHVSFSPSVHYLQMIYLPTIAQMGLQADIELRKWGWYPKGGGEAVAEVYPAELRGAHLSERGSPKNIRVVSASSNLPASIARRQEESSLRILKSEGIEVSSEIVEPPAQDKATVVFVAVEFENGRAGFMALGERGKRAEVVAEEAANECVDFLRADAAIDEHLADQLIPLMALAKGRSSFTTSRITSHLLTNIWVAEQFLPIKFWVSGDEGEPGEVSVYGVGYGQPSDG
ncbi:RNA 3'-terminal phosphate cyclase [Candidatus Poribacteria bacterium]